MSLMNQTLFTALARWQSPARIVAEILLIALIASLIAKLIWLIVAPLESVSQFPDRPLPSPYSGTLSGAFLSVDRTVLISGNPFAKNDVAEIVIAEAPETNLNLQLLGVFSSDTPSRSGTAFIKTPDNQTKRYAVGDDIIGGVSLERVLSDRVIINRDGASEVLMKVGRSAGLSVIGDDSQVALPGAEAQSSSEPSNESLPPIVGKVAGAEILFTAMSVAPTRLESGVEGYRVSARGDPQAMRQAGFEPGDVLLQFNGTPTANIDVEDLFETFEEIDTAILRVDRNGTERTIRLELGE